MDFLELKAVADAPEFISNKSYGDYYSEEQTHAIATFIYEYSSERTWQHLTRYFDGDSASPDVLKAIDRT
jgi:hypothetical protein